MKKLMLNSLLIFLIFIPTVSLKANESKFPHLTFLNLNSIEAYVFYQGNWVKGSITYEATQQGYTLKSYNFSQVYLAGGQTLSGYFYDGQRFTQLNQNNELAKKYNFTHYIDIQGIRAFIISN